MPRPLRPQVAADRKRQAPPRSRALHPPEPCSRRNVRDRARLEVDQLSKDDGHDDEGAASLEDAALRVRPSPRHRPQAVRRLHPRGGMIPRSHSATSPTNDGSIWWPIGVSRYSTSAPAASSASRAWRPHSTPITGSSVPWPIAIGGSGGDRSSSNSSTEGMNELSAMSAAGRGRPRPRPSEYVITPPCENPPSTSRPGPMPCSTRKPSSH